MIDYGGVSRMYATNDNLCEEGKRIVDEAQRQGIPTRLFGGCAVWLLGSESRRWSSETRRVLKDIDLFTFWRHRGALRSLLRQDGYAERALSPIFSAAMSVFVRGGVEVEVRYDKLRFCHEIDLSRVSFNRSYILNLSYLLLSKAQIVEPMQVDLYDLLAVLYDLSRLRGKEREDEEQSICAVLRRDWGFFHTFQLNCRRLREFCTAENIGTCQGSLGYLDTLETRVSAIGKTLAWKLRSIVGTKMKWYYEVR